MCGVKKVGVREGNSAVGGAEYPKTGEMQALYHRRRHKSSKNESASERVWNVVDLDAPNISHTMRWT